MDPFEELDSMFEEFGFGDGARTSKHGDSDVVTCLTDQWEDENDGSDTDGDTSKTEHIIRQFTAVQSLEDSQSGSDEDSDTSNSGFTCTCKTNCLNSFSEHSIETHKLNMLELEKNEKELFIMASLQKYNNEDTRKGKRRRTRCKYIFGSKAVCKSAFCYVNCVSKKTLRSIMEHFSVHGPVPRVHGNKGKKPHNALKYEEVRFTVDFLLSYADNEGIPMPAAPKGHDEAPPIYLPSSKTKKEIHELYSAACTESNIRQLGLSSFKAVWQNCLPHIRIVSPKDDVCHRCQLLKKKIIDTVNEQDKLDATSKLMEHVEDAQRERDLYKSSIGEATAEVEGIQLPEGPVPSNTTDLHKVHYTFDYSQNVCIPHHSQQMGPLYFVSGRKVQIFGIRMDTIGKQFNYLIDEDQRIGQDGKCTHGPNAVISMLHDCFFRRGLGERGCVLHADNCGAQNKNRYILAYLSWRINRGLHSKITLLMQVPGHTKCLVDGGFGHIKRFFRKSDCDCLSQLAVVVDKSAGSNVPVQFKNGHGEQNWLWYDWKSYLQRYFLPVKGIQKYHSFHFTSEDKGAVFVRRRCTEAEIRVPILIQGTVCDTSYPNILQPAGLSLDRQNYLYKHVRPFVRPEYQNVTCPPTTEE